MPWDVITCRYPGDLTDGEWEILAALISPAKPGVVYGLPICVR